MDPERRRQYLDAMGIVGWSLREPAAPAPGPGSGHPRSAPGANDPASSAAVPPTETADPAPQAGLPAEAVSAPVPDRGAVADMDWETLQARVSACTACELHASRTQAVFGVGNRVADWLIVGEAPGADEDRQGEPFVGRAGQLLNAMLRACGLEREAVYIANILKCRPPRNRDPRPEEVLACEPYLLRQIALVRPRIILAVGRIAAQNLLQCDTPIGKLRGRVHHFRDTGIPLVATYHPAYLLRSPAEKRKAWSDLQLAMRTLAQEEQAG
ncbi:MAG TPA: uracil-DNA glycosylase [Gammaproteobacteria bacterium]|nr:uracil-DNA glycosylase [Gammaproteobacteria bacterium]